MRISVVIPAYNEEKRIAYCLKSVLNQTQMPYEVIVANNNSIDRTEEIAKSFPGVTVITEKRAGTIAARDTGFDAATGDIIARTDADSLVPHDWIEKIDRHFEKDPDAIAFTGPATFGIRLFAPFVRLLVFEANKRIFGHYCFYGPNLAFKRSVWNKVRDEVCLDNERVHEDTDLSIHIGKYGKIVFDPKIKVRTSARRLRQQPSSLLVDYLIKWVDTIAAHKKYRISTLASNIKHRINTELND